MSTFNRGPSKFKSKLSRSYRFKKKTGRVKNRTDNNAANNQAKKARIIVRNLSFKTTEKDLSELYKSFGEIEEINLLKRPDGQLVGCGFIQFKNIEDASKAIFKTNKSEFLGRNISCEWAIPKSEYPVIKKEFKHEEQPTTEEQPHDTNNVIEEENVEISDISDKKQKKDKKLAKKGSLSKAEQRKLQKLNKRKKRSRIVIRNLPFTITEDVIKDRFSKYGSVEELKLLKKPDGTPTGCCFIQFDRVQSAAQAIHYENMTTLLHRSIIVDWAIPKDKFEKSHTPSDGQTENKNVPIDLGIVKEEENSDVEDEIKEEDQCSEEQNDKASESDINSDDSNDNDDDDDVQLDNENKDDKKNVKLEFDQESVSSHPKRISNDVSEGRTVFLKNVPFSATNDDLKKCMEQFGPVFYALICMDRLTEHSKGTAFVKFRNVEDAEKCLAAGTELKIHDQVLDPHKALHRKEVNEKQEEKKKTIKDSRNLYLVKEGVILASSPAAQDVSAADMARRLQLEQWKSQMLRNLNMFVSRVRLVIQNLPESTDDSKLRQLFKNHSNPNAVITEARVMRDLRNVDGNGVGKSKGYGFVSFSSHEDALKALRSLNNNPNIFTKAKRPIVAFSIENRIIVNAKQRRVEKSRQRNPLYMDRKRAAEGEQNPADDELSQGKKAPKRRKKSAASTTTSETNAEAEAFIGTTGKPGMNKMRGKNFLKKQAFLHSENLKQQKQKAKSLKQLKGMRQEQAANRREAKPKQGSKESDPDEAVFSRLVNSYKTKLATAASAKSKWYET